MHRNRKFVVVERVDIIFTRWIRFRSLLSTVWAHQQQSTVHHARIQIAHNSPKLNWLAYSRFNFILFSMQFIPNGNSIQKSMVKVHIVHITSHHTAHMATHTCMHIASRCISNTSVPLCNPIKQQIAITNCNRIECNICLLSFLASSLFAFRLLLQTCPTLPMMSALLFGFISTSSPPSPLLRRLVALTTEIGMADRMANEMEWNNYYYWLEQLTWIVVF